MNTTEKIRVAVLYGGRSGEHEVSILSATNVMQHLDRSRFDVVPIGIDKQGNWFLGDDIFQKKWDASTLLQLDRHIDKMLFNPYLLGEPLYSKSFPLIEKNYNPMLSEKEEPLVIKRTFDVVFPAIHGTFCEDGTVQGLLELADIPYVGCGVLSSAVCMDKDVSKRLVKNAGIRVATYLVIKQGQWEKNPKYYEETISKQLSYPVFVKPANTGSSVGISKVKHVDDLYAAIDVAFQYDTKVVVEQGIDAIEIEVAVLESLEQGSDPIVTVPGEIRPSQSHEFYSYASKYLDESGAECIIPAVLPEATHEKIRQVAIDVFHALECEGMGRVDLFVERKTGEVYFNEVNTLPGFTNISMYPKLMEASGMPYSAVLTHLIQLAIAKHTKRKRLSHEYKPVVE